MSSARLAQVKARGVTGNFSGDGFQLGGTFVIDTDGTVVLDHRQGFYGDDATNDDIIAAIKRCKGAKPAAAAGEAAAAAVAVAAPAEGTAAAGGAGVVGGAAPAEALA